MGGTRIPPIKKQDFQFVECSDYVTDFSHEGYKLKAVFKNRFNPDAIIGGSIPWPLEPFYYNPEQILKNIDIADSLVDMNDYQNEQIEALRLVRENLPAMRNRLCKTLECALANYLQFREDTDRFLADHFSDICSQSCYQNRLSACCSKDSIITFFADVVLNALSSDETDLQRMEALLRDDNTGVKCIYLSPEGCLWRIKPVVCQMYICDNAQRQIFENDPALERKWEGLKERKKAFTWPDRPVLFDQIEALFIDAGCSSPLMYCHNSPGLVHLKRRAGLI